MRGGAKVGHAPYVEFLYARYSNEILQGRQDLVGKKIWITAHKDEDCRVALATTRDGGSLGVVRAAPPWHRSPHSLSVRKAIARAIAQGKFQLPAGSDGIESFLDFVESQPKKTLPVYPAYLEARRILVSHVEQSVGQSMLDQARARVKSEFADTNAVPDTPANQAAFDQS